ncbi:hypothetical protein [Campylobacter troglodytis]|uniref:hypothetical protein n=1 Tax=Campylobacter troglodytis TaxID=654363 RepID=UPI001156D34C|nr:hypothetical protein [Campylobacter troglodytis]TQR56018.1 hypothetical protein DMC01_09515 [Campylobacter troglodytis]
MDDLMVLQQQRSKIFKSLDLLRLLAFLEAFIVFFLAFVASEDLIIALAVSIFVGVFFYRFLSKKLLLRQKNIENRLLKLFLKQNKAKFKQGLEAKFLQELIPSCASIKTANIFEFKDFILCDLSFKNLSGKSFVGLMLVLKDDDLTGLTSTKNSQLDINSALDQEKAFDPNKARTQTLKPKFKEKLSSIDEDELFERLEGAEFSTKRLFIKKNIALIASLKNPFFIDKKLSLKKNLEQMNANLAKIQALIA